MKSVILTPRLRLVPFAGRHLTMSYVDWLNNPASVRYSEQRHRCHTLVSCRSYVESFKRSSNHLWAIEVRDGDLRHIGNVNAYVDTNNAVADIGILIGEMAARGRGYALEAWIHVCRFLFESEDMRKVTAGMLAVNEPMCRLARRAGMRRDGRRRRHYHWEGRDVDVVYTALFREEWPVVRRAMQKVGYMEVG